MMNGLNDGKEKQQKALQKRQHFHAFLNECANEE